MTLSIFRGINTQCFRPTRFTSHNVRTNRPYLRPLIDRQPVKLQRSQRSGALTFTRNTIGTNASITLCVADNASPHLSV
jgi:hypothetical protein